jgi:hypothetical protein
MEEPIASKYTALVPDRGIAKLGTLVVTAGQVLFFDQKFAANAGLGLAGLIGEALRRRHEEGGPHLVIERTAITEVVNERKLLNRDRMRIRTADGDHLFNDGYAELAALLG